MRHVTLALDPSQVSEIPANVSAQILPKTIFGEQYVVAGDAANRRAARSRPAT